MKINCRLKATGGLLQQEAYVYPKMIDAGRISGKDLVKSMEHNSNVTPAMSQAVFSGMTAELVKYLMLGHSVEVPDLGVFRLDVKGKVGERENGSRYVGDKRVRISFTPKSQLNKEVNEVGLNIVSNRVAGGKRLTESEILSIVDRLLEADTRFVCKQFEELAGVSSVHSYRILNKLAAGGVLRKEREGGICLYSRAQV